MEIPLSRPPPANTKKGLYAFFSTITTILALGHGVALYYSFNLSRQLDTDQSKYPNAIANWNYYQNIPFAAILALFAIGQFGSSLVILISHQRPKSAKTLYYNSLVGLLAAFSIGVSLTILASEYNSGTRALEKNDNRFPSLMPFYWCIQVDATATFLFSVPMLLYIFYYNLEDYLKQQRQANIPLASEDQTISKQIWLLAVFLINAFAHVAFIFNIYQFTGIQETKYYNLDDLADQYTFYIAVEVVISLVSLIAQVHHFRKPFLAKNQLILVATLAAVFQFGSFILMAIKAVQFQLDISLMQNGVCYFNDCEQAKTFRWQIIGYSAFSLIALIGQIPYFRIISTLHEEGEKRDTLLTQQNYK